MDTMKFMFRVGNNILPFNLQKLYSIKLHDTYLFHRFKVKTNRKAFCLSITGPRIWNNLSYSIFHIS